MVDAVKKAIDAGAPRFCMGAAWRNPTDRNLDKVIEMVKAVNAEGPETCVTLGMLTESQVENLPKPSWIFTTTISTPHLSTIKKSFLRGPTTIA